MAVVRFVNRDDLSALNKLANKVDGFMTTMPGTQQAMRQRIDMSIESIRCRVNTPGNEVYFFVLEQGQDIIGVASIYACVGNERPFYSYRVTHASTVSIGMEKRNDIQLLNLVNDYNGTAELATLFLDPDKRGGGCGTLLSYARLLFMKAHRHRFPERVIAEIRGWTDKQHRSPFWDAVGAQFFDIEMHEADERSSDDVQFIADLMPSFPIYVNLLPKSAQDVIAKPNDNAKGAVALLKKQGFRYQGLVDIFDAGVCIDSWLDQVDIVRHTHCAPLQAINDTLVNDFSNNASLALIANPALDNFRVISTQAIYNPLDNNPHIIISANAMAELSMKNTQNALLYWLQV